MGWTELKCFDQHWPQPVPPEFATASATRIANGAIPQFFARWVARRLGV